MILYENVSKSYGSNQVVKNINLSIEKGEFVVLIGPSGCGKTTTLTMLNRLNKINSGKITIDGKDIYDLDAEKLRQGIGYVVQQIGLFPNMTVEENISVVPKLLKWDKEKCHKRVLELLELVGMPYEEYAHKYPNEMSGGQQQRIGVLRALAAEPPIILMDEPFGALDPVTRESLQDEVKALQMKLGITVLFVTHDMDEAIKLADKIIFMDKGNILQIASPEEMLRAPADNIIKEFMGKYIDDTTQEELLCRDVMKHKVISVYETRQTLQCLSIMNKKEIDSVVVVDEDNCFKGIVTIDAIKEKGEAGHTIKELMTQDVKIVSPEDHAKDVLDTLIREKLEYILVLEENKVVGIITKTSISKALANVVWGASA